MRFVGYYFYYIESGRSLTNPLENHNYITNASNKFWELVP